MAPEAHETISPELVLVDPDLAARVRASAVAGPSFEKPAPALDPPETLADHQRHAPPAPEPAPTISVGAPTPTRSIAGRLASLAATFAALALLAAAFLPPREAPRLTDSAAPATAASRSPVALAWRPVRDADYYLVEVYSGTSLVHAQSVRTPRLLAPSWLRPGRYTWRVFAGEGRPALRATRGPIESGWFVVMG